MPLGSTILTIQIPALKKLIRSVYRREMCMHSDHGDLRWPVQRNVYRRERSSDPRLILIDARTLCPKDTF